MKRISIIIASALAAMLSASCSKSIETPAAPSPGESIILDLSIAGFDGAGDTKAMKTGWTAGDKLNLWFDDWNYTEQANNPTPDLVITYDGTNWTAGALAAGRSLKPSGLFLVMYESSNNLSSYNTEYYLGGVWFRPEYRIPPSYDKAYCSYMVRCKYGVSYTFVDNKLTAVISDWIAFQKFRVLVKGLDPAEASDYILQASYVNASETEQQYVKTAGPIVIDSNDTYPTYSFGSSNDQGYQGGVKDADGVAFYYRGSDFTNADIEFKLFKKDADGQFKQTAKTPKYTNKTLKIESTKMVSIVIDKSKFE